jgi:hypothetical protein
MSLVLLRKEEAGERLTEDELVAMVSCSWQRATIPRSTRSRAACRRCSVTRNSSAR